MSVCRQRRAQVSARSGVFYDVNGHTQVELPALTILERVSCLECGATYNKPAGGGTARQNPGCPECGYVGWVAFGEPVREGWRPRRRAADPLPRPIG